MTAQRKEHKGQSFKFFNKGRQIWAYNLFLFKKNTKKTKKQDVICLFPSTKHRQQVPFSIQVVRALEKPNSKINH